MWIIGSGWFKSGSTIWLRVKRFKSLPDFKGNWLGASSNLTFDSCLLPFSHSCTFLCKVCCLCKVYRKLSSLKVSKIKNLKLRLAVYCRVFSRTLIKHLDQCIESSEQKRMTKIDLILERWGVSGEEPWRSRSSPIASEESILRNQKGIFIRRLNQPAWCALWLYKKWWASAGSLPQLEDNCLAVYFGVYYNRSTIEDLHIRFSILDPYG